ncbi:hypothetical protein [Streptomyces sp. NPDC000134]|uniref:hypothetical protein n=1 Tax=Streptomyces sp. NPDC000134 TaxID=3364536 RepID=UPI0036BE82B0
MSRETDSPSSGPHGRGGAAYPSGTPPYGTPAGSDTGTDAGRSATRPEDRKTETTLTTRIRINIPGSRPIPPVVMRKPVGEGEGGAGDPEPETPPPGEDTPAGTAETPAEPARHAEEKPTSDWFAPRRSAPAKGGAPGTANGTAPGGGSGPAGTSGAGALGVPGGTGGTGAAGGPAGPAAGAPGAPGVPGAGAAGGARPGGVVGSMNMPGGSRPGGTNGAGLPGATGGPVAPGHGGGTGSFDVTEALSAGPLGGGNGNGVGGNGVGPGGTGPGNRPGPDGGPGPRHDDLPYFAENGPGTPTGAYGGPQAPAGPTGGPATGTGRLTPPPSGGLSDDTAILTPQQPVPEPPGGVAYGTPGNVSGDTLTSGIPVVPTDRNTPSRGGPATGGPLAPAPPRIPEPVTPPPASPAKPVKPVKRKGRGKLPLLVGALVLAGGLAYGAGLLMNHSDVPKGTTVLGVDIGGSTRDDAVEKLDTAFEGRVDKPLKLSVDGDSVALKPDQAGLQFDTQATVAAAARSDYNPVSVIGSLFGNHRVVDPVMPVDEEKLHAALQDASGGSGSMADGTIRFESGRAVPVYPKAGKGIDVARSTDAVEEAYRGQVETGAAGPVDLPTTAQQPEVTKAEVDRMMKEFAEPAMSAPVTVQTDAAHTILMSPQKSLWKFLRVTAVDGKLVDKPDLDALEELYGQTFDGVTIARANGEKTPVTPQDVYAALRQALISTTDRVAIIDTDPS